MSQRVIAESYYIANNVYVTMPRAGFEPTKVGVTGFQLNAKRTFYLQATTAGFQFSLLVCDLKLHISKENYVRQLVDCTVLTLLYQISLFI